MSLRKVALACGLGLALFVSSGCNGGGGGGTGAGASSAAAKKVASIDEAAINQMDEFKKAQEELDKWATEAAKKAQDATKGKPESEQQAAFQAFQLEMSKQQAEKLNPLKDKARAAIALVAKEKGVTVVLDKKIVVYGVPDITEDVKKKLAEGGKLEYPKEEIDPAQSPIGYFDQDVVRNLKVFKEADIAIATARVEQIKSMQEKFQKEGRNPTPQEMQSMEQLLSARLQALQEQKMGPLIKAVTDSVADVAKEEKLSLVLDTQHVMHGGRNLTEQVVDSFLKKVDGAGAPSATGTPTPAVNSTPEG